MFKLGGSARMRSWLMRRLLPGFLPGDRQVDITPVEVPMSDGTILKADLLTPDRVPDGAPTIVMRGPYGRSILFLARQPLPLATHGYPVLMVSSRGTAGSGGEFVPQLDEQRDGVDTLRWVREQPWFTGRLATAGGSYLGYTQWAVAGLLSRDEPESAPEALSLSVTMPDFGAITWDHGAFSLRNALSWSRMMSIIETPAAILTMVGPDRKLARGLDTLPLSGGDRVAAGAPIGWYQDWLRHESLQDEYWAAQSHTDSVPDVTGRVVMTTGWYDIFLPWQIATYHSLVAAGRAPTLTVGPWAHASPGGVIANLDETVAAFDEHFRGIADPRPAPVRFQLTGTSEWHDTTSWPPPGTVTRTLVLGAGGVLGEHPVDGAPTRFTYDPADPTPATGGPALRGEPGPVDDAEHERRADVVTFTSEPLTAALDVTGAPVARVGLRSDRPSVDLFVRLTDVSPEGRSMVVCDGIRRVGSPAAVGPDREPGGGWQIEVSLWPTAHRFGAGHRLRVQVSSGAHPRYARNTGSGLPAADDVELHVAHQEILHEPGRRSTIVVPVWDRAGARRAPV